MSQFPVWKRLIAESLFYHKKAQIINIIYTSYAKFYVVYWFETYPTQPIGINMLGNFILRPQVFGFTFYWFWTQYYDYEKHGGCK